MFFFCYPQRFGRKDFVKYLFYTKMMNIYYVLLSSIRKTTIVGTSILAIVFVKKIMSVGLLEKILLIWNNLGNR